MYYIKSEPNSFGNYGNPQSKCFENSLELPTSLLQDYINARGFVFIIADEGTVTSVEVNQEALDAYLELYPDEDQTDPEPDPGHDEENVWDEMAEAIRGGVNDVG